MVAVIYPGGRSQGLASLAVHGLVRLFGEDEFVSCETIFFDGRARRPRSFETGRDARDFDLLVFTTAFEEQWVLIPHFLRRAGIPALAVQRDTSHPLVAVGGFAVRLNPAPVAPFTDMLIAGDAEEVIPSVLEVLHGRTSDERNDLLRTLGNERGVWTPSASRDSLNCPVYRGQRPVAQVMDGESSVFADMFLIETGRGCPVGCRFCAVAHARRPPAFFPVERILDGAGSAIAAGMRIGLVGASLSRHPRLVELMERLADAGADLSPASLDATVLASRAGEKIVRLLAGARQRTVTLAPECGTEPGRSQIGKPLKDDELECAVRRLAEAGVVHLKLYLMYGLPEEQGDDLQAAVELVARVRGWFLGPQRRRGRAGRLSVSANPFVPKPHTPLGPCAMPPLKELKKKRAFLQKKIRALGGTSFGGFSPRRAVLQCLLDRGGFGLSDLLDAAGGKWPPPAEFLERHTPDFPDLVYEPFEAEDKRAPLRVDISSA